MSTQSAKYRVLRAYGTLVAGHVVEGGPNAQLLVNQGVLERVTDDTPLQKQGAALNPAK